MAGGWGRFEFGESNDILAPVSPSQTLISWYGCTRATSTCSHTPTSLRNDTEEGVRLLTRLENCVGSKFQDLDFDRSWLSIRAILSFEVIGEDPGKEKDEENPRLPNCRSRLHDGQTYNRSAERDSDRIVGIVASSTTNFAVQCTDLTWCRHLKSEQ
ncbi:predicted protein [Histoplasma mississippiense (nom. inval.)]|uniref:predicted protein n=1 Tax=Ajellomyces capsulatus (strain NAm1 / WU24) TaxID=2059318 RepID=UPI000157CB84|nr:predicted protein [Histoplasma mississippiense (nom. inval.)]EDN10250.1 predicted protein [Histoplasma mississippiense (nom. inval.)]